MALRQPTNPISIEVERQLGELYEALNEEITRRIREGATPEAAFNVSWKALGMEAAISTVILSGTTSAFKGGGPKLTITRNTKRFNNFFLHKFIDPQSFSLSDKIVGNTKEARRIVVSELKIQIRKGKAWQSIAKGISDKAPIQAELSKQITSLVSAGRRALAGSPGEVRRYRSLVRATQRSIDRLAASGAPTRRLKKAYQNILNKTKEFDEVAIEKGIERAVKAKARFNAERIARTELARAYKEGFNVAQFSDTDIVGYRSSLASNHPKMDVCDVIAKADLHGFGAGVYPKGTGPQYPYHPFDRCVLTPVFLGEPKTLTPSKAGGVKFLKSISEKNRREIMGVGGAQDFKRNPNSWQKIMNFPKYESKRPKIPQNIAA